MYYHIERTQAKVETVPDELLSQVFRTPMDGCYKIFEDEWWGHYLKRVKDPDANVEVKPTETFYIKEDITKIPQSIFSRIVALFFDYAALSLEVVVRFYRNEAGTEWKCLVPFQMVSGGSADWKADDTKPLIDIITGQEYPNMFAGWYPAGSYHSHHVMRIEWSGTDDADELGNPGMHGLLHSMDLERRTFIPIASIVLYETRHVIPAELIIDTNVDDSLKYHPNVQKNIYTQSHRKTVTVKDFDMQRHRRHIRDQGRITSSLSHQRNDWDLTRVFDPRQSQTEYENLIVMGDSLEEILEFYEELKYSHDAGEAFQIAVDLIQKDRNVEAEYFQIGVVDDIEAAPKQTRNGLSDVTIHKNIMNRLNGLQ